MSGSTSPNAYPYATGTDAVGAIDTLTQALADKIETQLAAVKAGTVSSGTLTAGVNTDVNVTFTTPFPAGGPVPVVTTGSNNIAPDLVMALAIMNVTRNGFTIRFRRSSGTAAVTAHWIACNGTNW